MFTYGCNEWLCGFCALHGEKNKGHKPMSIYYRNQLSERNSHIIERLDTIYKHKNELNNLPLKEHDKYVIMSDLQYCIAR